MLVEKAHQPYETPEILDYPPKLSGRIFNAGLSMSRIPKYSTFFRSALAQTGLTMQMPGGALSIKSSPFSRLFRGASWTLLGTVIAQGIAIASTITLARFIGKLAYGQFGLIQSTALMFASVAGAGFGITATRYVSLYRITDPARVGRVLGMLTITAACTGSLFGVALLTLSSSLFFLHALSSSSLSTALSIGSPYVIFLTLNGFQLGALTGLEAFKESAIISAIQAVFNSLSILLCAHFWGLYGAIAALNASGLIGFFLLHAILMKSCRKRGVVITYQDVWKERSAFLTFGLPAAISGILGNIAIWGCYAITANAPGGFKELGAISAANNLRQAILFVPGIVTRVALPINCSQHGQGHQVKAVIVRQFKITVVFAVLAAVIVILAAPFALRLFGKEFTMDGSVVVLFVGVAVCEVAAASLSQVLVIMNKMWVQAATLALWGIVLFVASSAMMHSHRPALAVGSGYLIAWSTSVVIYGISAKLLLASK